MGCPTRDFPMPTGLVGSAAAYLDDPGRAVVPPRPSASVLLLRERRTAGAVPAAAEVEVFVQHRATTMAFAPDVVAFPGGGVDPRDAELDPPWSGPAPGEWADRLGVPEPLARQVVLAAARELFEECGVLLASPGPDGPVPVPGDPTWQMDRADLLARRHSFAQLLTTRRLLLRSDLLTPVGRWITPVCEPRRYDTWFFATPMPPGQVADGATTEAVRSRWVRPSTLLAEQVARQELMLPPTQVLAEQWASLPGPLEQVLRGWPPVHPVLPWPVRHHSRLWMRAPVDRAGHGIPMQPTGSGV